MEPLQRENLRKQSQVGLLIWLSGLLLWVSGWLIWLYGLLFCSPCLLIWSSGLLTWASARINTPAETICLHSSRCSHPTSRPHIVALADTARIFKPRRIASNKMFEPKRISNIFAFATTTCLISRSLSPTRQHKASLDLYLQFRYTGRIRCDAEIRHKQGCASNITVRTTLVLYVSTRVGARACAQSLTRGAATQSKRRPCGTMPLSHCLATLVNHFFAATALKQRCERLARHGLRVCGIVPPRGDCLKRADCLAGDIHCAPACHHHMPCARVRYVYATGRSCRSCVVVR